MIFDQEFIREMNYRAKLLRTTEPLRVTDNIAYSKLVEHYKAEHGRLYMLPIGRLKELVGDIG